MMDGKSPLSDRESIGSILAQIKSLIANAPLNEIRSILGQDIDSDDPPDEEALKEILRNLASKARRGDAKAIETLASAGGWIAQTLADWAGGTESASTDNTQVGRPHDDITASSESRSSDWRAELNSAAQLLAEKIGSSEEVREAFETKLDPNMLGKLSFPLGFDPAKSRPIDDAVWLASDFCESLLNRQLRLDRMRKTRDAAANVLTWPLAVSAIDFRQNMRVSSYAPWLRIGTEVIAVSLEPRTTAGGPADLTSQLYTELDQIRKRGEAERELDPTEPDPESGSPVAPDSSGTRPGKNTHAPPTSETDLDWEKHAEKLPPLTSGGESVGKWVEAAFAWIYTYYKGDLVNREWNETITKRIKSKGSVKAGIKHVLREGFETLAGKDRKKNDDC